MRIVTYLIEYLGQFKFIFKSILDYESGDQMDSFDAKKPPSKISCLGTFNLPTGLVLVGGWGGTVQLVLPPIRNRLF
jgi:hypothetical protein